MAVLRESGPYIWVTWLTKLMVGENSCEWAAWFRGQHEGRSWRKVPSDFNLASWQIDHTELVNKIRNDLESQGQTIFVENQNSFTLRGASAALAGKPDIIATREGKGLIVDAKTGTPSPSHLVQVMTYMYAVPKALKQYGGMGFDGRVVYQDHEESVPASAVDQTFINNLGSLIRRLASSTPARKVPSPMECGYCNITKEDCPERAAGDVMEEGATEDF